MRDDTAASLAARFAHLRCYSTYSLGEGALRMADLGARARDWRVNAMALTDTANLFGALEFAQTMRAGGVQPIAGLTMPVHDSRWGKKRGESDEDAFAPRLVFLAADEAGWAALKAMSARASAREASPGLVWEEVLALGKDALCLTGGAEGPFARLTRARNGGAARRALSELREGFGDRLFLEVNRYNDPGDAAIEPLLLEEARKLGAPVVATHAAMFADASDYEAHDLWLCVSQRKRVHDKDRRRSSPAWALRSPMEMARAFADLPEALTNAGAVAQMCTFCPTPRAPAIPSFADSPEAEAAALAKAAQEGLADRLARHGAAQGFVEADYRARLDSELRAVGAMGFAGYFLIVAEFVGWSKDKGIPVGPGRGSGAGSLLAWALRITDLDPLEFGLLFERFLNPARASLPDFDIDFCQERRDEALEHVRSRYGADKVAQIITFGGLAARAAIKDTGRAMGLPYPLTDRLTRLMPRPADPSRPDPLSTIIENEPRLREEIDADPEVKKLMEMATRLEGLYRHASVHAAGVVIADRPIQDLAPVWHDRSSGGDLADAPVMTQYSMNWAERAGLVKFDFLGLKTLTILSRAQELARAAGGNPPEYADIPLEDEAAFAALGEAQTVGAFQLEGSGMRDMLRSMRPSRFDDIIAAVALFRPGPMDNIPEYLARRRGDKEAMYPHPAAEPALRETWGVAVYQEQVMGIARDVAGFTLAEADLLRRAMGKKIPAEMKAQQARFITGAREKGLNAEEAQRLFAEVESFAGYGFNKSHAAAYALVAWWTMWMKVHWPGPFLAASMTVDRADLDRVRALRNEALRLGVAMNPPDVNSSAAAFAYDADADAEGGGGTIRHGLMAIRGVGEGLARKIEAVRVAGGAFASLGDLLTRVGEEMGRPALEALIKAGALDGVDAQRGRLLAAAGDLTELASRARRFEGEVALFSDPDGPPTGWRAALARRRDVAFSSAQRFAEELESCGAFVSGHPLEAWAALADAAGARLGMGSTEARRPGALCGALLETRTRRSRRGRLYARAFFSSPDGEWDCVMFDEAFTKAESLLKRGTLLVARLEAEKENEDGLVAREILALDDYINAAAGGLTLRADADPSRLFAALGATLAKADAGKWRASVGLRLRGVSAPVRLDLERGVKPTPELLCRLEAIPGIIKVAPTKPVWHKEADAAHG